MKVTEQTTLAELQAYLTTVGDPFLTVMKSNRSQLHGHNYHAVAYVPGWSAFNGSGDTIAGAIEDALGALRAARGITNLAYEPLNYVKDKPSLIGQHLETSQRMKQDPAYNKFRQIADEVPTMCGNCKQPVTDPYAHVSNYGPSYTCSTYKAPMKLLERDIARGKAADDELRRRAAKLCHGCRHTPSEHPNETGCQKWHDEP